MDEFDYFIVTVLILASTAFSTCINYASYAHAEIHLVRINQQLTSIEQQVKLAERRWMITEFDENGVTASTLVAVEYVEKDGKLKAKAKHNGKWYEFTGKYTIEEIKPTPQKDETPAQQ